MSYFRNPLAEFVYLRTYSRWIPEENRRETWEETIDRYMNFMKENLGDSISDKDFKDIREAVLNQEVMPSMRLMQFAGEAARRNNVSAYNCFAGDEEYVTKDGIKSFVDTVGTKQTVLAGDGEWREAEIKDFGTQSLNQITFRPGSGRTNLRHIVKATPDHRWITKNRGEVTDLKPGDQVSFVGAPEEEFNLEDFIAGFGFGDGTITSRGNAMVRLCGDKQKLLPYFEQYGNSSIYPIENDMGICFHKGHFKDWKRLPKKPSYWWFMGYIEADGHKNVKQPGISTQDPNSVDYIFNNSIYSSLAVTGINWIDNETNYGKRRHPLARLGLREDVMFYVESIEPKQKQDTVYCAVEPITGSFTLKYGILTGNCSFLKPSKLQDISEIMFLSMSGTGVGFSVEKSSVAKLPRIEYQTGEKVSPYVVPDSREGWSEALAFGLKTWFSGKDVEFDLSELRPAGARLKTTGGKSSGPDPLRDILAFTRDKILAKQGDYLSTLDVHDIICKIGEGVVSGGVRRTALISLSDLNDKDIRDSKTGQFWYNHPQRALANNSAIYNSKPSMTTFMDEWFALLKSGTGERGIFNRGSLNKTLPERRIEALEGFLGDLGTNPCFEGNTLIHTEDGHFPIKDLVGQTKSIWDGQNWVEVDNFRITGENMEVIKIKLQDGSDIKVTPYHTMVLESGDRIKVKDLSEGDRLKIAETPLTHGNLNPSGAYLKGFLVGDGTNTKGRPLLWLYDTKYCCEDRLIQSALDIPVGKVNTNAKEEVGFSQSTYNRKIMTGLAVRKDELISWATDYKKNLPSEIFSWNLATKLDFIAGVMDADGTASDTKNGWLYQISSINKEWLLGFQNLLKTIGVGSKLSLNRLSGKKDFGDGYGEYESKDCYRLTISQESSIKLAKQVNFSRLISFKNKETTYKVNPSFNQVVSITPYKVEDKVYCLTVPETHSVSLTNGILTGQCGEIILQSKQLCNLSEIVARPEDTEEDLLRKARLATILGTYQATLTKWPYLSKKWKDNCEKEALLGVSVTGQWDCPTARKPEVLRKIKEEVIEVNKRYASKFGINQSTCATAVKPSGTVSQTVDCSSGMHTRYAPYYVRRIRISVTDSLFQMLKDQGVPYYPEVGQSEEEATTYVLEFPVKAPETSIFELSAIEQLEHWKMVKENYTEHNPSVTVTIDDDEWLEVGAWVYKNWDIIGGLSFLPKTKHVYQLAPYEEITKQEYNKRMRELKGLDFSKITEYEVEDETEVKNELACSAGACEIN